VRVVDYSCLGTKDYLVLEQIEPTLIQSEQKVKFGLFAFSALFLWLVAVNSFLCPTKTWN